MLIGTLAVLSGARDRAALAQRARWQQDAAEYRRVVRLPEGATADVIVADFFAHGALRPDAKNLAVWVRSQLAAWRVLQVGPGDYCRIAIQAVPDERAYQIYYGGEFEADAAAMPKWTADVGLVMETRRWQPCDLNRLESIQQAFRDAPRLGMDYVPRIFHRHNPFDVRPAPFLSYYRGRFRVTVPGEYAFFTSSQDASFVLIDGRPVVAAPGKHPPDNRARHRGTIRLTEGPHRLEYWHAASGPETCMVLAWQMPGFDRPSLISPAVFGSDRIVRVAAEQLEHRSGRLLPDFRMAVLGDVPADEEDQPAMVRVQFADVTSPALSNNARFHWDFGDGQTSQLQHPGHVYLLPKAYTVTLTIQRGTSEQRTTNRVYVTRSIVVESEENPDTLASYLELLEQYNAQQLDPAGLVQLVRAYLRVEEWGKAVQAGRVAFTSDADRWPDDVRVELLRLLVPLLRFQLGDEQQAAELLVAGFRLCRDPHARAACAIDAADVLINDLLQPQSAAPLLQYAEQQTRLLAPEELSKLHRVQADLLARAGDGEAARKKLADAARARQLPYDEIQQIAWRGAHARSSEAFLRRGQTDRLRRELDRWQTDFPQDKAEGFWSWLLAQYWAQRGKYAQAVAVARDLVTVNPDSPQADQLLYLAALCEAKRKDLASAAALLQTLVHDYPGSPLVERARRQLERCRAGQPPDEEPLAGGPPPAAAGNSPEEKKP